MTQATTLPSDEPVESRLYTAANIAESAQHIALAGRALWDDAESPEALESVITLAQMTRMLLQRALDTCPTREQIEAEARESSA